MPTYLIYFFDIQNPDEILAGARPVVAEVGPYAYKEYYVKFDIEWEDDGDTVKYNSQRYYVFDQENSGPGLSDQDLLVVPYAAVIGFSSFLSKIPPQAQEALDTVILGEIVQAEQNITALMNQLYQLSVRLPPNHRAIFSMPMRLSTTSST